MRKKTPRKKRPGNRPKWRPLGTLTEDHYFILSIVTVFPGTAPKRIRKVYLTVCELAGKRPWGRWPFLQCIDRLLFRRLIRLGVKSLDEKPDALFPGPCLPERSLRRRILKDKF